MSWGTCISGSNNIHFNSPPLMSDTRMFTDYKTSCKINDDLIKKYDIKTNNGYRQFLINNAKKIVKSNKEYSCHNCGVCKYGNPLIKSKNPPKYLYKSFSDRSQPYGYENSDLKSVYLSRDELQKRLVAPILSQQQLLNYPRIN